MHIKTTLTKAMLAVALLSLSAFATAQTAPMARESRKQGDPEAAAQSKVEARSSAVNKSAKQPEAMTSGSDKAKAAAEARVEAKGDAPDRAAKQPEAMTSGSDKAKTAAEAKVARKPATVKKNRADEQMSKDAKKL